MSVLITKILMNFFRNHDRRNIQLRINLKSKVALTFFNNNNARISQTIQIDSRRHKTCKNAHTQISNIDFNRRNKTQLKRIETRSIRNLNTRSLCVWVIILLIRQIYLRFRQSKILILIRVKLLIKLKHHIDERILRMRKRRTITQTTRKIIRMITTSTRRTRRRYLW